ncbi:MAG TPA: RHS repeat-associated core domain-containing protein [Planctomycetes bacterium]|nr:RHS repeat-associated core domain-containing protein [Planctomycetota bacterium]
MGRPGTINRQPPTTNHQPSTINRQPPTAPCPLADHLNTVRDLASYDPATDTTTVANHLAYDAFGTLTSQTAPTLQPLFLFTARPFDPDTALQNNLHRWYDPAAGRWLSEDPLVFQQKDGNPYRYVGNSVTTGVDAWGLYYTLSVRFSPSLDFGAVTNANAEYKWTWSPEEIFKRSDGTSRPLPLTSELLSNVVFWRVGQATSCVIPSVNGTPCISGMICW